MDPECTGIVGRIRLADLLEMAPVAHHGRAEHGDACGGDRLAEFIEDPADDCAGARERNLDADLLPARERYGLLTPKRPGLTELAGDVAGARHTELPRPRCEARQFEAPAVVRDDLARRSHRVVGRGNDRVSKRNARFDSGYPADDRSLLGSLRGCARVPGRAGLLSRGSVECSEQHGNRHNSTRHRTTIGSSSTF